VQIQFGELTAKQPLTVSNADLIAVALFADEDPLHECQSTAFTATGTYNDGTERPLLTGLTWSTDQDELASFKDNLLLSHDSGLVDVQVEAGGGVTSDYSLTMTDTLTGIAVSSGDNLTLFVDDEVILTASGDYNDGSTGLDISENSHWTVDDSDIASLDQQTVTGLALGSTQLWVVCGGLSTSVTVDVIEYDDIAIVDPEPDLDLVEGETRQLELYKTYSNEDVDSEDVADQATWSMVQGESIADIDETGRVTMSNDFSRYDSDRIRIEAEYDDFSDEIEITIPN
jgi:hypothetical protein